MHLDISCVYGAPSRCTMGIDVMVHKNRCTGTTTNKDKDVQTEIDNCGADGCEIIVEAEEKMTGFYFNKQQHLS
jgi:hypothetical protein